MADDNWERVQEVFLAAADLPEAEQTIFLDSACRSDLALRREVEDLLRADGRAEPSLAAVIESEAGSLLDDAIVGSRLGPYRVIREIGSGGMGAVYLARRDDDQYQKQVAIKVVKRGMDTAALLGRFRHERQILANLDHPFIARLLDGGTTPDGRPFFVMEYVEGERISAYCREQNFVVNARLHLFLRVCEAVSYAHRHHIVHRDLKPGNILVTADGIPKLLDFGVAKILSPDGDSGFTLTAAAGRPLTPEYASPEQVRGLPPTAGTDVYALGAILYELLTDTRAQRFSTRTPTEIERVVCETEVRRPSSVATDPALAKRLAGDLDNIVLMAMRKESARRYQSVDELAEDIRRHLQALPVTARKRSLTYRGTKFVRRNRFSIAATSVVILSLLLTAYAFHWRRPSGATSGPILRRFTFDSTMTMEPDISPDGRLVGYVTDRADTTSLDLWVQPAGGGDARRLTNTPGDERYPRFSPDGSQIVYYLERDPTPGIYIIPTAGGQPRKLLEGAGYPRFSPDGKFIACLLDLRVRGVMAHDIAVIPASGGAPRVIPTGISAVSAPIWSPDGKHLLFRGANKLDADEDFNSAWYLVPVNGGKPQKVEVEQAMRQSGMSLGRTSLPLPDFWYENRVIFSNSIGDSSNLWAITLSPSNFHVEGIPRRLTFGAEMQDRDLSVSNDGVMAYGNYASEGSLYNLSLRTGELKRLTSQSGFYRELNISSDGTKLLYAIGYRARRRTIIRDLTSGADRELSFHKPDPLSSQTLLSPDASRIVYERHSQKAASGGHTETMIRGVDGAPPELLCEDCGVPTVWFPGGRQLVTQPLVPPQSDPRQFTCRVVDLATRQVRLLTASSGGALSVLSFSPDGQWALLRLISAPPAPSLADDIFLAPVRQNDFAASSEWIPVPAHFAVSRVAWAPDGNALYFFSDNAENYAIESLVLDPLTKRMRGPRRILYRFNRPAFLAGEEAGLISIGENLIFSAIESKGNIWLMQLPR